MRQAVSERRQALLDRFKVEEEDLK
jgi:hypothetical protein